MAKPPVAASTPAPEEDAPPVDDTAVADVAPDDGADEETDEVVLLTVCKHADGSYSLIKGDEDDAEDAGAVADDAGVAPAAGDVGAPPAETNKQMFDSKGALLKGILDILNEDEAAGGDEGGSEDQFQAGFEGAAGGAPAAPVPQKY